MIEAVIAEDEALLRRSLCEMLASAWPELHVSAECADGASAVEAIAEHQPAVAFLDIRMPGLGGLDVACAAADASPRTRIVFVTAYDQYAIEAFERGAIDYLLKPVTAERLAATVERLKARSAAGPADAAHLVALLQQLGQQVALVPAAAPLTWVTASHGRETRLILVEDVAYFRAEHKYTSVVTADGESLLRKPIRELLDVLDAATFKQIHRSTIVNLKAIAGITRDESGRGILRLRGRPETLVVSQPYMGLFRNM